MIGSFLTRGLVMVFGYAYPAYECYKTVERNTPEIEQLRFWCQYWILVAVLTVCERVGGAFVSWVPMYSEAKLAFFIYLWYPKTKGATYVYDSFFRPYIAKHENDIDQNLLEMRTRAGDMLILYWQRAASYGQTRVFDILQFIAAQSTPRPRTQEPQDGTRARQPSVPTRQPSIPSRQRAAAQLETVEPPSPSSNTSSSQQPMEEPQDGTRARQLAPPTRQPSTPSRQRAAAQMETVEPPSPSSSTSSSLQQPMEVEEVIPPKAPETASAPSEAPNGQITRALSESSAGLSAPSEPKAMLPDASSSGNENADPKAKETLMEDTMRVTRAKLRKTRSGGNR